MSESSIYFRNFTPDDIPTGLKLCRHARWNQLATDWELFLSLSPQGCRVAVQGEQVVGTMTTVGYEDRFAWVGMVLVDPEFRGKGLGTDLLEESLRLLSHLPCIRLDATPQGRPVYQRLDFVDEYELRRMQLDRTQAAVPLTELAKAKQQIGAARGMAESDLAAVIEVDRTVFGAGREQILRWAWEQAREYAWIVEGTSGVEGYCFGRHGFNFDQIGPIYASAQTGAQVLVTACLAGTTAQHLILDPLHHSPDWITWLQKIGFVHQRPFTRMYRGRNLYPGNPRQQWAIFGPEFG